MTQRALFHQGDIERILKAAKNSGFQGVKIRIDQSGQIEAIIGEAANDALEPVELE